MSNGELSLVVHGCVDAVVAMAKSTQRVGIEVHVIAAVIEAIRRNETAVRAG